MSELHKQGLLKFICGVGEKNLSYLDSNMLNKALKDTTPHSLNNIEQIAFSIAIGNPNEITKQDLLIYGQVLEVLKQIEARSLEKTLIEKWAMKARMTQHNPGSINYITNMSNPEILREENKMQVEKEILDNEIHQSSPKKRRQDETAMVLTEESCQNIINNMEDLAIEAKASTSNQSHLPTNLEKLVVEPIKVENNSRKDTSYLKTVLTETNQSTDQLYSEVNIDKEQTTATKEHFTLAPLEDSFWSPQNRTCNRNDSFKAKIPTYKIPGETKEYRINFMKWVLRNNKHIKAIEESFQNGNNWIIVDFDCDYSRRLTSEKVMRKEGEWCKLIPIEVEDQKNRFSDSVDKKRQTRNSRNSYGQRAALRSQKTEYNLYLTKERRINSHQKGKEKIEDTN